MHVDADTTLLVGTCRPAPFARHGRVAHVCTAETATAGLAQTRPLFLLRVAGCWRRQRIAGVVAALRSAISAMRTGVLSSRTHIDSCSRLTGRGASVSHRGDGESSDRQASEKHAASGCGVGGIARRRDVEIPSVTTGEA